MAGSGAKSSVKKVGKAVASTAQKAGSALEKGPSPNPMTNLIIADVALRGGGRLLRHVVERTLLGVKYPPDKAKNIVKGKSMTQTLLGTAVARIATRSVPGALLVGGGLLAKTLYDHGRKRKAEAAGERAVEDQADAGDHADKA
ncbi:hypothetical protein [Novosphingobium sp. JCM 18896]|uniref:hypothetical protein n=1 Tax=Novosphingobium sp. JCM 18896 TaxID=2989731 RepID=UPI0022235CDA|nr:hypothetical protein [Novosphingobium sp. JCM 18896]MCW1430369.1 hypothetical protein [Novosphingobium sp. JCM 18896]